MDWIHCNACYRQPGDEKERKFFLTNCGHMFCDCCVAKVGVDKCSTCNNKCQMIQLSSKMKADTELYFLEPGELLKRQYNQLHRLLEFQKSHRILLVSFLRNHFQECQKQHAHNIRRLQELEKKYASETSRNQELEAENHKLRSLLSGQGGGAGSVPAYHIPSTSTQNSNKRPRSSQGTPSQESVRISPGRITLVKAGPSSGRSGLSPASVHSTPGSVQMQQMASSAVSPSGLQSGSLVMGHGNRGASLGSYIPNPQPHSVALSQQHCGSRENITGMPASGSYRNPMSSQVCFPTWSRGMSQSTNRSNLSPSGQQLQQLPNRCYQYPPCISSPQNSFPNCAPQQQQSRPHGTLSGNPVHHYIGNSYTGLV